MMSRIALSLVALLAATPALAGKLVQETGGCQVEVPSFRPDETFHWIGNCTSGKASGEGTLTSSNGGYLYGQFMAGEIVDASGRWPLAFKFGLKLLSERYAKDAKYISRPLLHEKDFHFSVVSPEPLIGKWRFEAADGSCREMHRYQGAGFSEIESGQELSIQAYALLRSDRNATELALLSTVVSTNGKADCLDGFTAIRKTRLEALKARDLQTFEVCDLANDGKCFGTLTKVSE